jgi:cell division protein FtsI (penicillin-binding protein 3)
MFTRIKVVGFSFLILFSLLLVRLFYWQVYKSEELSVQARKQYQTGYELSAPRGEILASDSSWLAATQEAWLVYASLPDVTMSHKDVAEKLAPLFVDEDPKVDYHDRLLAEIGRIETVLSREGVVWAPIKSKVDRDVKEQIETMDISGIGFEEEDSRYYPEASTAAQILGFVGKNEDGDDEGYFGLEGYYNSVLSGKPGFLTRESDASGLPIILGTSTEVSAIGGVDLVTSIDKAIQINLDSKLKDGIEKYGAKGGTAIVMEPSSGRILAMSSYPSYDPAKYSDYGDSYFLNPAISSSFEPGSVFKVVIMASALDMGAVEPDTECDICSSALRIGEYTIRTWDNTYHPNSTMTDVIVHSDNVGMAFAGGRMGADNMYNYLDKFGIGKLTGIDLQGEATPQLRNSGSWAEIDVATASFGQGVAVTPVQLIRAVGAIANNGVMTTPSVVDKIIQDGWEEDVRKKNEQRVVSDKAAKEITAMMAEAAENGESKWTYMRGYKVAGKTGTAQIPIAGHYDDEKTIASFIGFAPYDDPKFIMLITLHQPETSQWASETAAPLWYSIAGDLFSYFGIQPK